MQPRRRGTLSADRTDGPPKIASVSRSLARQAALLDRYSHKAITRHTQSYPHSRAAEATIDAISLSCDGESRDLDE